MRALKGCVLHKHGMLCCLFLNSMPGELAKLILRRRQTCCCRGCWEVWDTQQDHLWSHCLNYFIPFFFLLNHVTCISLIPRSLPSWGFRPALRPKGRWDHSNMMETIQTLRPHLTNLDPSVVSSNVLFRPVKMDLVSNRQPLAFDVAICGNHTRNPNPVRISPQKNASRPGWNLWESGESPPRYREAFLCFPTKEDASKALVGMDGRSLDGLVLHPRLVFQWRCLETTGDWWVPRKTMAYIDSVTVGMCSRKQKSSGWCAMATEGFLACLLATRPSVQPNGSMPKFMWLDEFLLRLWLARLLARRHRKYDCAREYLTISKMESKCEENHVNVRRRQCTK